MKQEIKDIRSRYEQMRGQEALLQKEKTKASHTVRKLQRELEHYEMALEVIKSVGLLTQQQLQFHIADIVTMALAAIFEDPYQMSVEFVERRNKTECDLMFIKDEELIKPIDASGGGTVDVAAFGLRIASWAMQRPRSRNTIILDEPMRFLSEDKQEQASALIKQLSEKLNLQFIIITHEPTLTIHADRIFTTSKRKKYTVLS